MNTNMTECPTDSIMQEDIEYLATYSDFSALHNASVLVTGATGLIGAQFVRLLLYLNRTQNAQITVYALIRNAGKAQKIFGSLYEKINSVMGDITQEPVIKGPIDYIIHGASITASKAFVETPVETIATAYLGTSAMLDFARKKQVKSFVYLSSMEVFGVTDTRLHEVKESDYGYIDILDPRSSYSESKRMCECLCACYAKEYNVPVKIARLAQVVGAGVDYNDSRVGAQFARSVLENKDIVLKTEGKTLRPCIYTRDAIAGIITVLLKGVKGQAYSIANKNTAVTIREIAQMVAEKIAQNKIKVVFDISHIPAEYAPNLHLNLNVSTELIQSLGWSAEIGLEESYRRMIKSMEENHP
jgi:dTDP-glucose 4,6-dehydratase